MRTKTMKELLMVLTVVLGACIAFKAEAAEVIAGPIAAVVTKVGDGDTFEAKVRPWLDMELTIKVRVLWVNTPELYGYKCPEEKVIALTAKGFTSSLILGKTVHLYKIRWGKYARRVLAEVVTDQGRLDKLIIDAGHGRYYDGGTRGSWCEQGN